MVYIDGFSFCSHEVDLLFRGVRPERGYRGEVKGARAGRVGTRTSTAKTGKKHARQNPRNNTNSEMGFVKQETPKFHKLKISA